MQIFQQDADVSNSPQNSLKSTFTIIAQFSTCYRTIPVAVRSFGDRYDSLYAG